MLAGGAVQTGWPATLSGLLTGLVEGGVKLGGGMVPAGDCGVEGEVAAGIVRVGSTPGAQAPSDGLGMDGGGPDGMWSLLGSYGVGCGGKAPDPVDPLPMLGVTRSSLRESVRFILGIVVCTDAAYCLLSSVASAERLYVLPGLSPRV